MSTILYSSRSHPGVQDTRCTLLPRDRIPRGVLLCGSPAFLSILLSIRLGAFTPILHDPKKCPVFEICWGPLPQPGLSPDTD